MVTPSLDLYLRLATDVLFVVIGWKAVVHYLQCRDREHLYFAVLCAMLLVSTVFSELALVTSRRSSIEGTLFGISLASLPVIILMLAGRVRPLPRAVLPIGLAAFVFIIGVLVLTDWRDPNTLWLYVIVAVLYVLLQATGAYAFWREARASVGMNRNRYTYIFIGCILLSISVLILLTFAFLPSVTPSLYTVYVVTSALTASAFVVGFEPPYMIRQGWQATQITTYQSKIINTLINKPADRILRYLAKASMRAVGGQGAIIVSYDTAQQRLSLTSLREQLEFVIPYSELDNFGRLIQDFNPQPSYMHRHDLSDERLIAILMDGYQANAIFAVPVIDMPNAVTVLLITMQSGSLFVNEDLAVLNRYASQARAILENNSLIAETQTLVEELRDETGDLEDLVLERERALRASEDELRRRLVQLSALYRELEAFSNSVSHDLRAPLRAISGFANALIEDYGSILPADAATYVERIRVNSAKLDELMNAMLKLSKLSRSEITYATVDLTEEAVRVSHELRAQNPGREVSFSVDPGMTVTADPALMKVLLTNLLDNAWKFTRHTLEPKISLSVATLDGERVFRVSDNGTGFDMTYSDKLFKPFQRLHTEAEFEGNGIGLAIVQRIVNRHGGRVWAEAEPDSGARFFFTLPARVT